MGRLLTRLSLFLLTFGTVAVGAFVIPASAHPIYTGPNGSDAPPLRTTPTLYTVAAGDTLSTIGQALDRTWEQLAGYNSMTWAQAQEITPGQVLKIPPASYVAPPLSIPVAPAPTPAHTYTASVVSAAPTAVSSSSGFEACVIARESGGNAQIMNGSGHWGLYQFSYSTWVANGGSPSSWGHASASEQHAVFVRSSPSNWQSYDGC